MAFVCFHFSGMFSVSRKHRGGSKVIKAKHGLFRAEPFKAPGFNILLIDSTSSRSSGELYVHQFRKPLTKPSLKERFFLSFRDPSGKVSHLHIRNKYGFSKLKVSLLTYYIKLLIFFSPDHCIDLLLSFSLSLLN